MHLFLKMGKSELFSFLYLNKAVMEESRLGGQSHLEVAIRTGIQGYRRKYRII